MEDAAKLPRGSDAVTPIVGAWAQRRLEPSLGL